jgi:hypothetical protein
MNYGFEIIFNELNYLDTHGIQYLSDDNLNQRYSQLLDQLPLPEKQIYKLFSNFSVNMEKFQLLLTRGSSQCLLTVLKALNEKICVSSVDNNFGSPTWLLENGLYWLSLDDNDIRNPTALSSFLQLGLERDC